MSCLHCQRQEGARGARTDEEGCGRRAHETQETVPELFVFCIARRKRVSTCCLEPPRLWRTWRESGKQARWKKGNEQQSGGNGVYRGKAAERWRVIWRGGESRLEKFRCLGGVSFDVMEKSSKVAESLQMTSASRDQEYLMETIAGASLVRGGEDICSRKENLQHQEEIALHPRYLARFMAAWRWSLSSRRASRKCFSACSLSLCLQHHPPPAASPSHLVLIQEDAEPVPGLRAVGSEFQRSSHDALCLAGCLLRLSRRAWSREVRCGNAVGDESEGGREGDRGRQDEG
eukprot:746902-Hanusia_phi.AAC.6